LRVRFHKDLGVDGFDRSGSHL